jgi:hypothetical protein
MRVDQRPFWDSQFLSTATRRLRRLAAASLAVGLLCIATSLASCAVTPGLRQQQAEALRKSIHDFYEARLRDHPAPESSLQYVCAYGISQSPRGILLDPVVIRGTLSDDLHRVHGKYCIVVGFWGGDGDRTAVLCETVTLPGNQVEQNVYLLAWDPRCKAWWQTYSNLQSEGANTGDEAKTPSKAGGTGIPGG